MYQLAKQSIEARREFFTNTATRMQSRDALVEKDFWICFLLELLFHQSSHARHLCLKGGTPARYSRHYYDLCMLAKTTVKQEAFEDLGLLSEVAEFKNKFYHCSWARYDEATPDKIKLVPPQRNIPVLRKDYELMQMMISGAPVPFDEIMEGLRSLEDELKGIAS